MALPHFIHSRLNFLTLILSDILLFVRFSTKLQKKPETNERRLPELMKHVSIVLPAESAEMTMMQRIVRLTKDLEKRLPELKHETQLIREITNNLKTAWIKRPTTVLGTDTEDDLKEPGTTTTTTTDQASTHVALETEYGADPDLEMQLKLAKRNVSVSDRKS